MPFPDKGQDQTEQTEQVLIVQVQERFIGIAIDIVSDLQKVRQSQIKKLIHSIDKDELFNSSIHLPQTKASDKIEEEDSEHIFGLLDIPGLMALCKIWAAESNLNIVDNLSVVGECAEQGSKSSEITCAIFEIANRTLGINAEHVASVQLLPTIQKILGADANWLGMCKWRNRDVPVLSTLEILGINPTDSDNISAKLLVILNVDGQHVGLPVDEINSVRKLNVDMIQSPGSAGFSSNTRLKGIINNIGNGGLLLVDAIALVNGCPMSSLSINDESSKKTSKLSQEAFIVIDSGQTWVLGLKLLEAIIDVPNQIHRFNTSNPAQLGSFIWNQKMVPLWDLLALNSDKKTAIDIDCKILLVQFDQLLVGILIEKLLMLLPSRSGQVLDFSTPGSDSSQIMMVEQDGYMKSFRILDPAILKLKLNDQP